MQRWLRSLGVFCVFAVITSAFGSEPPQLGKPSQGESLRLPRFSAQVIDPEVGNVCYAVTSADVDGDGKLDLIAVTENRVVWFQNPDWKLRVIIADQTEKDNVCIAPHDIDGDGKVDFALGAGWTKVGTIQWLSRGKSLDEKWNVHPIGKEGWLHRMRWGNILGKDREQLIIAPLNKTVADGVRLTAFEIPENPAKDPWKATVLDASLDRMHNHWVGDFDGDNQTDILTASKEGVFLFQFLPEKGVVRQQLGAGAVAPDVPNENGAGEIKVGKFKDGRKFIVTVEPMHGNGISVYTPPKAGENLWQRHVVEEGLKRGHAVAAADLNRDGTDELIIGHSDPVDGLIKGPGIYIYTALDATGANWSKTILDNGGIATEDLIAEDFDGDGWIDIAAGGRATHNVKLYRNLGGD